MRILGEILGLKSEDKRSPDDSDQTDDEEGFDNQSMRANRDSNRVQKLDKHQYKQKPVNEHKDCSGAVQVPYTASEQVETAEDRENGGSPQQDAENRINDCFHVAKEKVRAGLVILCHGSGWASLTWRGAMSFSSLQQAGYRIAWSQRALRSLDPLPADGRLLASPRSKEALIRRLRDYLHQVCHTLGLSTSIVPHQFRHTYATEMLRSGVSFPVLMKLLGHTSPEMTMHYVDVTLTDLQREFRLACSKPRHLAPQPKIPPALQRKGLDGIVDSLLATQHAMVMFRRSLPASDSRSNLNRLANRVTKILVEIRKLRAH
jgi:hypothetical protein